MFRSAFSAPSSTTAASPRSRVCKRFRIVPISDALERYARLRVQLERRGESIDDFDLLIAATALTAGYTLVTHNLKHFDRIEGLRTEDWDRMS